MIKVTFLKKIIGKKVTAYIKLLFAYPEYEKVLQWLNKRKNKTAILLIGTPIHDNLGDHLIAEAEKNILRKWYPSYEIFEIPMEMFFLYKKRLKERVNNRDIIFVSGGGWMGNLWEHDEKMMQDIVSSFKFNNIFVFPQTIYYDEKLDNYYRIIASAKKCYKHHNNLIICLRDLQSYEIARFNLKVPVEQLYLMPDIGLLFQDVDVKEHHRNNIAICMRQDCEKNISDISIDKIEDILKGENLKYVYTETVINGFLPVRQRKKELRKKLQEFANYSLVITDRLHAMIFAVLTNTPCIAFNNRTGKVYGVYALWLCNKSKVIYVESEHQLKETLLFMEQSFSNLPNYNFKNYYTLFYDIKEKINNENR